VVHESCQSPPFCDICGLLHLRGLSWIISLIGRALGIISPARLLQPPEPSCGLRRAYGPGLTVHRSIALVIRSAAPGTFHPIFNRTWWTQSMEASYCVGGPAFNTPFPHSRSRSPPCSIENRTSMRWMVLCGGHPLPGDPHVRWAASARPVRAHVTSAEILNPQRSLTRQHH
jgi:hypothetical protein